MQGSVIVYFLSISITFQSVTTLKYDRKGMTSNAKLISVLAATVRLIII